MQLAYRLIARFIAKRPHLVDALIARARRTPYSTIMSRDGQREYMRRAWLFNAYQDQDNQPIERNWFMRLLPSIRIHEIMLKDDDEHLHDHPWNAQTLILRGWYVEQRENPEFDAFIPEHPGNRSTIVTMREAGDSARVNFGEFHRIIGKAEGPVVTLFITFRYGGVWGFKVNGQKVPWREYLGIE